MADSWLQTQAELRTYFLVQKGPPTDNVVSRDVLSTVLPCVRHTKSL